MITKEENLKYFVEIMALHGIDLDPDDENENSYYRCNDNGNSSTVMYMDTFSSKPKKIALTFQ